MFILTKAFTLLEFVLALVILALITSLMLGSFSNFFSFNYKFLNTNKNIINSYFTMLSLDKMLNKCLNIKLEKTQIQCFLKDDLLKLENKKISILNSGFLLQNKTSTYLAKSDIQAIFENKKYLYNDTSQTLYALVNNNLISFKPSKIQNLSGPVTPVKAKLIIYFENGILKYIIRPHFNNSTLEQRGNLAILTSFEIKNNKAKLCSQDFCLEKRLIF